MTKEDLVALAELLRTHNQTADGRTEFTPDHIQVLANFCAAQYSNFNRQRWIDYVAAEGRQGDESISVKPGSTLMLDTSVEGELVLKVNRDKGKRSRHRPE